MIEKELIVFVSEEARLPDVPALNDVHWKTGDLQARATGHGEGISPMHAFQTFFAFRLPPFLSLILGEPQRA